MLVCIVWFDEKVLHQAHVLIKLADGTNQQDGWVGQFIETPHGGLVKI
jgi:hypothetical protein